MGRFYKASATPIVDYSYKLPYKELFTSLQYKQNKYDTNAAKMDKARATSLSISALDADKDKQNSAIQKWDDAYDLITKDVGGDLSLADGMIRDLSNEMVEAWTVGEEGGMMKNKALHDAYTKEQKARLEKGDITMDQYKNSVAMSLANYKAAGGIGDGGESGRDWNSFSGYQPVNYVDIGDILNKFGNDTEAMQAYGIARSPDGQFYLIETQKSLSAEELKPMLRAYAENNDEIMAYMGEKTMFSMYGYDSSQTSDEQLTAMKGYLSGLTQSGYKGGLPTYAAEDLEKKETEDADMYKERITKLYAYESDFDPILNAVTQKYDFVRESGKGLVRIKGGDDGGPTGDPLVFKTNQVFQVNQQTPIVDAQSYEDKSDKLRHSLDTSKNANIQKFQGDNYAGIFGETVDDKWKWNTDLLPNPTGDHEADRDTAYNNIMNFVDPKSGQFTEEGLKYLQGKNWTGADLDGNPIDLSMEILKAATDYHQEEATLEDLEKSVSENLIQMINQGIIGWDDVNYTEEDGVKTIDVEDPFKISESAGEEAQSLYIKHFGEAKQNSKTPYSWYDGGEELNAEVKELIDKGILQETLDQRGAELRGLAVGPNATTEEAYRAIKALEKKYYDPNVTEGDATTTLGAVKHSNYFFNNARDKYNDISHEQTAWDQYNTYIKDHAVAQEEVSLLYPSVNSEEGKKLIAATEQDLAIQITPALNADSKLDASFASSNVVNTATGRSIFDNKEENKEMVKFLGQDGKKAVKFQGYVHTNGEFMSVFKLTNDDNGVITTTNNLMVKAPEGTETTLSSYVTNPNLAAIDASGVVNPLQSQLIHNMMDIRKNQNNSGEWGFSDNKVDIQYDPGQDDGTGEYKVFVDDQGGNRKQLSFGTYAELSNWYLDMTSQTHNEGTTGYAYIGQNVKGQKFLSNPTLYRNVAIKEATEKFGLEEIPDTELSNINTKARINYTSPKIVSFLTNLNGVLAENNLRMKINDAYRTEGYNNLLVSDPNVPAITNSLHTTGNAIDMTYSKELVDLFKELDKSGKLKDWGIEAGYHANHIHIEIDPSGNTGWKGEIHI